MASTRQNITINEYNLDELSVQLTKNGNELDEIKRRIQFANRTSYSVLPIL